MAGPSRRAALELQDARPPGIRGAFLNVYVEVRGGGAAQDAEEGGPRRVAAPTVRTPGVAYLTNRNACGMCKVCAPARRCSASLKIALQLSSGPSFKSVHLLKAEGTGAMGAFSAPHDARSDRLRHRKRGDRLAAGFGQDSGGGSRGTP
jgi:hypothetical protein